MPNNTPKQPTHNEWDKRIDEILLTFAKRVEKIPRGKTYGFAEEKQAINAAVLELVVGEDIQPKMGGEPIPRGKTVTIDMENNLRESCVFIEDNAKYMLQQKQRQTITGKSNQL